MSTFASDSKVAPARRRRALAVAALLALALHAALIGGYPEPLGHEAGASTGPVSARTIEPAPTEPTAVAAAEPVAAATISPPAPPRPSPMERPLPRPARRPSAPTPSARAASAPPESTSEATAAATGPRAPTNDLAQAASASAAASDAPSENTASVDDTSPATVATAASSAPAPGSASATAPTASTSASATAAAESGAPAANGTAASPGEPEPASAPALFAAGERPPPTYPTRLPPPLTLRYEVRRGFLRGTGEIRWRPDAERYALSLEASIAGLTLLVQSSQGALGADGLAPARFVDQRARRAAQAANFQREQGKVTFSGSRAEWPIVPGGQDRLSWMIQLAGIAAADPSLLEEGGRIAMVVVGARGDAAVWTLRSVGRENVETANGTVSAIKLVRAARTTYDTTAEVWLDPAHGYLPAHATMRNSAGVSDYDLLLERVEPAN